MKQYKEYRPILSDITDQDGRVMCERLRQELIQDVAKTGGHLASNLGVVELTVALHRVFDTTQDRLVFDVGHQCYPHKMLTGRNDKMSTLRQFGGLAGFPKPSESIHDAFIAGHASNSVAVSVGMARARTLMGEDYHVMALIGDGALTGGLAYEGLSTAGQSGEQILVLLNDNGMSIGASVGGVADHLARQRLRPQYLTFKKNYRKLMRGNWVRKKIYHVTHKIKKIVKNTLLPSSMFENMGFTYLGPVDGHDLDGLTRILRYTKELKEPVLLHVRTTKGKGYTPAEKTPHAYHGVSAFNPEIGIQQSGGTNFSNVVGHTLVDLANKNPHVCAITAAMAGGTGLDEFAATFPNRFFDVGIAEGCAIAMAAGMAKQGLVPVFTVYSTFLQRAYDMLLHDVALEGLHVVLGVDRAGLVGDDGETHHGVFDVAFLDTIPGMTVFAPSNYAEVAHMMERAVQELTGPVAVRYPRGAEGAFIENSGNTPSVRLSEGSHITLVSYGTMINEIRATAEKLSEVGVLCDVIKLNTITPLDTTLVVDSVKKTGVLLVAEDCIEAGCVGVRLATALAKTGISSRTILCNEGNTFTTHGTVPYLKKELKLDKESLFDRAMEVLNRG